MLRSRIARTNSKLEIFTGIVNCRQKKSLSFSKSLLMALHFTFFITFVSSLPMIPCAERHISHGIWVFSRVWSIILRYLRPEYIFHLQNVYTLFLIAECPLAKYEDVVVSYYASQTVFLFNLTMIMLLWQNILLSTQCFGRLCQSPRHGYSRKLDVWLHRIYSRTSLFRTRLIWSPRYFEGRSNALGFTLPLYAFPVISKPRYFERFYISLGTSK